MFGHGCPFDAPAKYRCHRGGSITTADCALPSEALRACSHLCLKGHQNQHTCGAGLGRCHHTRPDASFQVGTDSHIERKQMGVGSKRAAQPSQSPKLDVQSWENQRESVCNSTHRHAGSPRSVCEWQLETTASQLLHRRKLSAFS